MNLNSTFVLTAAACAVLSACGGGDDTPVVALSCDNTLISSFKPDTNTTVLSVKQFKKGDALSLSATPDSTTPTAANDVCMVKLNVGPGNSGPTGAPSTSAGIGIEVWLPAKTAWNNRVHALGGGGWQGGNAGVTTAIASTAAAAVAGNEGAVSSTTDTGHAVNNGSFAMNPDGTVNTTLWTDFASRSIHEQALKTKALATAFYGSAPKYSYWEGGSTGGRQGLNLAQNNPTDFDGIVALYPAINWTRFITNELYPQIVVQRDLGGVGLTAAQHSLVSNAAISACDLVGTQHLGYLLDPSTCAYDPTTDPAVLCSTDGGTNTTTSCVTRVQATAFNKIWYGQTADGSVPSPAADNGWAGASSPTTMGSGTHRWFGLTRGANLQRLAGPTSEFPISSDLVALELQDSRYANPNFLNAVSNGVNLWKQLAYSDLSYAYDRGLQLQSAFGNINTDNPDLTAFKARGGKMLTWHGLADELIMPQGTVNYYNSVISKMGGLASVQDFYRLYLVPGMGHGSVNGTANPNAAPPVVSATQMYDALTAWVEKGTPPDMLTLTTPSTVTPAKTGVICVYPKKITYTSGSVTSAASYTCS